MTTLAEMPILSRLVKVLSHAPSPQDILELSTTSEEEKRLAELREKMHGSGLNDQEKMEVQFFLYAEHIVKMAKIEAHLRLRA